MLTRRRKLMLALESPATKMAALPNDLVLEILTRLPGKQIGRCKCVCRPWRTMICSRPFMEAYRRRQSGLLLYWSKDYFRQNVHFRRLQFFHCPLRKHDEPPPEKFTPLRELELVMDSYGDAPQELSGVTQLVDGMICVGESSYDSQGSYFRLTLQNICTGEKMMIPDPLPSVHKHATYHLGYDPNSRAYKLLRLIFISSRCLLGGAHIMTLRPPSGSLSTWRELDSNAAGISDLRSVWMGGLSEMRTFRDDGMMCWFTRSQCLCFDLSKERFWAVEAPVEEKYDEDETGMVMSLRTLTRFEDRLALWIAFYQADFTVISCYVQEDNEGKNWKILKEVKESGRFAFADGGLTLSSSSAGGEMLVTGLDQPQRVYPYSRSRPQAEHAEHAAREDVLLVGKLPEVSPALNAYNLCYIWKRRFQSEMGRLSCFAEGNNLYLALDDIFGGASAIV